MKHISVSRGYVALVDDEDFSVLSQHKWSASERRNHKGNILRVEVVTRLRGKLTRMHRMIMNVDDRRIDVDHREIAHLPYIDNRRSNLRIATRSQNNANSRKRTGTTSKFKGVYFHSRWGKWTAEIKAYKKRTYLGCFTTEQAAHQAYLAAAREAFGEYARA